MPDIIKGKCCTQTASFYKETEAGGETDKYYEYFGILKCFTTQRKPKRKQHKQGGEVAGVACYPPSSSTGLCGVRETSTNGEGGAS